MRALLVTVLCLATITVAGCGGDNLALCDGCPTRTPERTTTPTPSVTPDDGLATARTPGPRRAS
jgi:hypothetical protein